MRTALAVTLALLLAAAAAVSAAATAHPADTKSEPTLKEVLDSTVNRMIALTLASSSDTVNHKESIQDPQVAMMERALEKFLKLGPASARQTRDVADIEHGPKRRDKRNLLQILSEAVLLRPQYMSEYLHEYVEG
ncbi:uncharacterized protein LOC113209420 isoform X2 [Frankliniella occidentalis]|uniref:Uncharacterized protein LOC113209420 isoform X2 n=1 Tax=Frankliniella occidentalis TaxID=133901 RepID=A0A9C6U941_FRAOC|nr:uncharacterized protein LOC113209420 isoform X2 [Frankliniella occidentalis]XP_052125484.1 uncharacterized protein LOC113209420 isoform X2 [Frankliniella occidentalis]XP_052125485.1 uncharacterized protein LOC113209420 isoform X2 [Frankliniella occidentalis]